MVPRVRFKLTTYALQERCTINCAIRALLVVLEQKRCYKTKMVAGSGNDPAHKGMNLVWHLSTYPHQLVPSNKQLGLVYVKGLLPQ